MSDVSLDLLFDDNNIIPRLKSVENVLGRIESETRKFDKAKKKAFDGTGFTKFNRGVQKSIGFVGRGVSSLTKFAAVGGAAFTAIGVGATAAVKPGVDLAIQYEQTRVSFETFLGSAEKAKVVLADLEKFSVSTPFTPEQVNAAGKALLAFGVQADELEPSLKAIGDISAGTGKDFNELATIFGKAKTAGTLFAEDINQLTEAGVPIIQEFAKQLGVTEGQVKKLASEGQISFSNLETAFQDLSGEGGLFFDLMAKQSQTVGGRISTLQGNFSKLQREIGDKALPVVGELVDQLNEFVQAIDPDAIFDFLSPIADELLPTLEGLYDDISNAVDILFGFDEQTDKSAAASEALSQAFDFLVRGFETVINLFRIGIQAYSDLYESNVLFRGIIDGLRASLGLLVDALSFVFDGIQGYVDGTDAATVAEQRRITEIEKQQAAMLKKAKAEAVAAVSMDAVTDATTKSNEQTQKSVATNAASRKEVEKLGKAYEKLRDKFLEAVGDAQIEKLTGTDRIAAERDKAISEIDKMAEEVRAAAKSAGKALPEGFSEGVQDLKDIVESEAKASIDKLRKEFGGEVSLLPGLGDSVEKDISDGFNRAARSQTKSLENLNKKTEGALFKIKESILSGLGINEQEAQVIIGSFQQLGASIVENLNAADNLKIAEQQAIIERYDERIAKQEETLSIEEERAREGFANNAEAERDALEKLQKQKEAATKKQLAIEKRAAKRKAAIDAANQIGSLLTASATLFEKNANIPIVGIGLAIAAIATMFSAFAAAKSNAAASTRRLYTGGFVNLEGHTDRHGGKGHRVENSNLILGGREFVMNEAESGRHAQFLQEMNKGKYKQIDLREIAEQAVSLKKINKGFASRAKNIVIIERDRQERISEQYINVAMQRHTDRIVKAIEENPSLLPITDDLRGYFSKSKGKSRKIMFDD